MSVHIVEHPLMLQDFGRLRQHIPMTEVRSIMHRLAVFLTLEATQRLSIEFVPAQGWMQEVQAAKVEETTLSAVPILRAGLGMLAGFLQICPGAKVSFVGMERNEETFEIHTYYQKLIPDISSATAFILDPMLATGGTMDACISLLKEAGCGKIHPLNIVASPEGVKRIETRHPEIDFFVLSIDEKINDRGYILPGIGDAGDRLFGTLK